MRTTFTFPRGAIMLFGLIGIVLCLFEVLICGGIRNSRTVARHVRCVGAGFDAASNVAATLDLTCDGYAHRVFSTTGPKAIARYAGDKSKPLTCKLTSGGDADCE